MPAHRETCSPGYEPTYQPLAPKVINGHWGPLSKINYYDSNLGPTQGRQEMSCHWDGGRSQGDTRHSMPSARRQGGFYLDV